MIGYICKYTPVEIIEALGEKCEKIEAEDADCSFSDTHLHSNLCIYAKTIWNECLKKGIDRLVLVNCCDSIKRLYDVISKKGDFKYVYMLDLPRKKNELSIEYYKNEIDSFIDSFLKYKGIEIDKNDLYRNLKLKNEKPKIDKDKLNILILGARCNSSLEQIIAEAGADKVYNFTCTGKDNYILDDYSNYTEYLLNQIPCMRMDYRSDTNFYDIEMFNGIICHTLKFCDFYSYEYSRIKQIYNIPILKIESDYSYQSEGQIKTRIEAFMERVKGVSKKTNNCSTLNKYYTAGIDSGSQSTNAVIIDNKLNIVSYSIVNTGPNTIESAKIALDKALKKAGLNREDILNITSTGYGRVSIPFSNNEITEISCHAKGAFYYNSNIRTIIDIGGQDSKVIKLDSNGKVIDFAMNDKCAAGTGRFLEMMAKTLGLSLEEMSKISINSKEDINITSMCTVFAESEVVSLIANNKKLPDIVNALEKSVCKRTRSLLERIDQKEEYIMTGGVAKNEGIVRQLGQMLDKNIIIPDEPQIIGALGAAIFAYETLRPANSCQ